MKTATAKDTLSDMIALARSADSRGDVVMRQQWLRSIEDLPLSVAYVSSALRACGLLGCYRGRKA